MYAFRDAFAGRIGVCALLGLFVSGCGFAVQPPSQPTGGPGSSARIAATVRRTVVGDGGERVYVYEPGDGNGNAAFETAPVIVFLHGYGGVEPAYYGAWIEHLVLRGNNVLFPVYQASLRDPETYMPNLLAGVTAGFDKLQDSGHVHPHETAFAVVGHSLGATLGMNLAAEAHSNGLPEVRALLCANAGDADVLVDGVPSLQTGDYDQVPADMLFLGVVGDRDDFVGEDYVLDLYAQIGHLPQENREVIRVRSDTYGRVDLIADHRAPVGYDANYAQGERLFSVFLDFIGSSSTGRAVNAVDYYGYWKWFDGLTAAAFYDVDRDYALGNTPEQTFMGLWSDDTEVLRAVRIRPE